MTALRFAGGIGASLVSTVALALAVPAGAFAAPAGGWTVRSIATPTNFSQAANATCTSHNEDQGRCDQYALIVTNASSRATSEAVTIEDTLPEGVRPIAGGIGGVYDLETNRGEPHPQGACTTAPLRCTTPESVPAGDVLEVTIEVEVEASVPGGASLTNTVTVHGGGAGFATVSASAVNRVNSRPAPYGVEDFFYEPLDEAGGLDTQAGAHPYTLTSGYFLNSVLPLKKTPQETRDVVVELPLGMLGDPLATSQRCTAAELEQAASGLTRCPSGSRIGTVILWENMPTPRPYAETGKGVTGTSPLYDMAPEAGFPAEFGFVALGADAITLKASVVPRGAGYALRVAVPRVARYPITGVTLTFFGDPRAQDKSEGAQEAFFTNPSDCAAEPLAARFETDSWETPEPWSSAEEVVYPRITGCGALRFDPSIKFEPQTSQADEPSGYTFALEVPQAPNVLEDLATPPVRKATVTLPQGVSLSPGAAEGLTGCTPAEIDIGPGGGSLYEVGPGEVEGVDGLPHAAPGKCPPNSQIGTVKVKTPLLEEKLEGGVYLAEPQCGGAGQEACTPEDAVNGKLYGVYLELRCSAEAACAQEPGTHGSGVIVKLPGTVSVNTATGEITTRFREDPQLPFEKLELKLMGGERAPLSNPQGCGTATTTSDFSPWSAPSTPDATPSSHFTVDWNGTGQACPASAPFAPSLLAAQSTEPLAGASSPFTLTFARGDREQNFARVAVHLPPGLLGEVAKVTQCEQAQANAGSCPESSKIGTATVASGSGPRPLWLSGQVYLTGSYEGQPFGLAVVVPAVAGPFNLGDVVVRSAISVNPETAAVTVTSGAFPQIVDGVPVRLRTVNVTVNRPGFMLDPTSCTGKQVSTSILSAQGATANLTMPYAVTGCANLPFKPSFKASTRAQSSRRYGAAIEVKVAQRAGEAAIHKVEAQVPKKLSARLQPTLNGACTEAQFARDPAGCPEVSFAGYATAHTPVLAKPLSGPAIFVSHGGAKFPDLDIVLQGEGVTIDLTGHTEIAKGLTFSRFETVPDAPISSFELTLPLSTHSALASNLPARAKFSFCGQKLTMPTTITGQNGAVVEQMTKVKIEGCKQQQRKKKSCKKTKKKTARTAKTANAANEYRRGRRERHEACARAHITTPGRKRR